MTKKTSIWGISFLLVLLALTTMAEQPAKMQIKVYYDSVEKLTQLQLMQLDIIQIEENYTYIMVCRDELNEILLNGHKVEIINEEPIRFYQTASEPTRDMGGYKTLSEIEAYIDQMILDHPDIVRKIDIGLSIEGRTMWAIKVSDNPDIDEDEPEVLITGMIHSSELIGYIICLETMDQLTNGYGNNSRMTFLVDNREIWFIPVVNVDGWHYNEVLYAIDGGMVRKNRRDNGDGTWGVDLNRNFGYMWGFNDICSSPVTAAYTYRGTGPFSEPEAQNIRDFMIAHDFIISLNYHANPSINWLGWPFSYDQTVYNTDEITFAKIGNSMTTLSGYSMLDYCVNGGLEDWAYGEQTLKNKCFSFVVEAGMEFDEETNLPPLENIPAHLDNTVPMCLNVASIAGRLDVNFEGRPDQPILSVEEVVESQAFDLSWSITEDIENPLFGYEIVEYPWIFGGFDDGGHLDGYEYDIFVTSDENYYSAPESYYSQSWPNTIHYLQTLYPYAVQSDDILEFWTYYDIQDRYDYAYVEVSTDGTVFTPIEGNITTNYNPNGLNRGNGITGQSGDWLQGLFDLSDFEGQDIYVRFSFYTDNSIVREGIYIDDISPISFFDDETTITSVNYSDHHTFIEHAEGYFYYKMRAQDIDGHWGDFSETVGTYVKPAFVCGDADGDEAVNILDVVFLLNYKYKSGPTPEIIESSDVNSDTRVDILDIVYLINFKYKDGPEPICP